MAADTTQTQCHAITEDGERCKRPAGDDGFCYQHDESNETVDEYEEFTDGDARADDDGESRTAAADGGEASTEEAPTDESEDDTTEESEADASDEPEDDGSEDETSDESGADDGAPEESDAEESDTTGSLEGVRDVRETVQSLAPEIIGRELDAVIEVDGREDGWLAVVEVVERPAVPDSQDILGRYEIDLDDGSVTGYRRVDRYRRGDTDAEEPR